LDAPSDAAYVLRSDVAAGDALGERDRDSSGKDWKLTAGENDEGGLETDAQREALDQMRRDLEEVAEAQEDASQSAQWKVEGATLGFAMSLIAYLLRGANLLAMYISSIPMWQRIDPLVVLSLNDEEREERERKLREAAEEENRKTKGGVGKLLDEE